MNRLLLLIPATLFLLAPVPRAIADGPADNDPAKVKPIPPKGVAVPEADKAELTLGLVQLKAAIEAVPAAFGKEHPLSKLLPDVEIYLKAVQYALHYDEFFAVKDIAGAKSLLKIGLQRAKELRENKPSWLVQTGYVVRGYRSKIDGSVQPYGLSVPKDYDAKGTSKHRLDFWWHGRGENLSEVNFMANEQKAGGIIYLPDAFVLLPYGRYCNANKLAGEVDSLECLEHAKANYRIDENRLVARGFSMGGAACWQYAVHYPTLFAAAAPGAGFSETPEFLNVFQNEKVEPTWYEKKLWRMYNASESALNIFNLPTVAYSGEIDRQKQAADVMERELKKLGMTLTHIIGPKTAHAYEPGAKKIVNEKIDAIVAKGKDTMPKEIRFTTPTLRYNQSGWITIDGLEKHWEPGTVVGQLSGGVYNVQTQGVTTMTLELHGPNAKVILDGAEVANLNGISEKQATPTKFARINGKWLINPFKFDPGHVKSHGLQGPIDDAFMDSFLMVKPTGSPLNELTGKWVEAESKHAIDHWRKQFRGDARVKNDTDVTDDDIKNHNLILWGDPKSNAILAKIADKLPLKEFGDSTVTLLIYPNPLNPKKYVVLNSGFTFREYDYLNNARQVPKLPDYAVVDVTNGSNSRYPGKIVRAGFFGEKWELLPNDGQ